MTYKDKEDIQNIGTSWWTKSGNLVNSKGTIKVFNLFTEFHEIIPVLSIAYRINGSLHTKGEKFKPGCIFEINNLKFKVMKDPAYAICLSSIGNLPYHKDNIYLGYNESDVKEVIDDWFEYFIKDIDIDETAIIMYTSKI